MSEPAADLVEVLARVQAAVRALEAALNVSPEVAAGEDWVGAMLEEALVEVKDAADELRDQLA